MEVVLALLSRCSDQNGQKRAGTTLLAVRTRGIVMLYWPNTNTVQLADSTDVGSLANTKAYGKKIAGANKGG